MPWLKFAGVVVGCAVGGFGIGALLAALVAKRVYDEVVM
jgi:ABC-type phosphate/phosphonate transport system permease subunit